MKKMPENICKFVTETPILSFQTLNFIFEKKDAGRNHPFIKSAETMYLIVKENGILDTENKSYNVSPGMIVFTFAGEKFRLYGDDGFEYMYITFKGERAGELFERFGVSKANRAFCGFDSLLPFWQNALGKADTTNLDLISESVLLYTFSQMSEIKANSEQHLVGNIINYIENYFSDKTLSLTATAQELGYNPKYISRIFSQNVGITFSEYLKNTRIKHSVFLIESGLTAVKNISILSGYSDPLYFSNVFKSTVGISPSEYIAKVRNNQDKSNNE